MLPDFQYATSYEEVAAPFQNAAKRLMLEYDLVVGIPEEKRTRITSLELYLFSESWPDPNCDRDNEQLKSGTWYVKRDRTNANRSRIDITCGNATKDIYCGLLVQSILESTGPGRSLKQIVRGRVPSDAKWTDAEITILNKQICGKSIFDSWLRLEPAKTTRSDNVVFRARETISSKEPPWDSALQALVASA
ncbi:hypothetical protein [Rhodopseudomonas palustris]|uniref:hypothetical protein n=1 Tax=Rhodopseudomonas palustris TaxID=1076 RepID=UPI0012D3F56F|nr:hypothetical protein [Rhodopseudomonas palustris]